MHVLRQPWEEALEALQAEVQSARDNSAARDTDLANAITHLSSLCREGFLKYEQLIPAMQAKILSLEEAIENNKIQIGETYDSDRAN